MTVTESEIHLMVLKHTNAVFTPPISNEKSRELSTLFWREVEYHAQSMDPEDAAYFKERIHFRMEEALESWPKAIDDIPDESLSAQAPPCPVNREQSSSYVGRTVVRAVVWNLVNGLFRVFR
ncbi:hypothetical protein [Sphingomonas oryzagri]